LCVKSLTFPLLPPTHHGHCGSCGHREEERIEKKGKHQGLSLDLSNHRPPCPSAEGGGGCPGTNLTSSCCFCCIHLLWYLMRPGSLNISIVTSLWTTSRPLLSTMTSWKESLLLIVTKDL